MKAAFQTDLINNENSSILKGLKSDSSGSMTTIRKFDERSIEEYQDTYSNLLITDKEKQEKITQIESPI